MFVDCGLLVFVYVVDVYVGEVGCLVELFGEDWVDWFVGVFFGV